ncbi:MAG: hypothetical protein R3189_08655 [Thiomicrorhabdus chilensis]|uniref:hypothetical protein n=1 Tax=Thiomicrorhabdus chilensis TaxID=63656 RepID=UPI00299E6D1F|nr:hypothetical protein [Thiomicrorhabdus chilensis]MDX1348302.1 hypothetical protein [Thiomicrorhabdus chilensis]
MELSPMKRALRNSLLISLVVGGLVIYQGQTPLNSLMTALFTFAVTFPALWLSFRYTQNLLNKYKQQAENSAQEQTESSSNDSSDPNNPNGSKGNQ